MIRGFPNRETGMVKNHASGDEYIVIRENTQGTETSKYLEEEKTTVIP